MTKISETTFNELKETFDKAIQEAFGAGRKSAEQEAQMDAIKVGDTVRYLGGDEEYEYLTAGKNYKILKKSTHPIENIPVLQIRDNRGMDKSCSLIRPDTVHLFEVIEETPVIELQVGPPWGHASSVKSPNQQRGELNQRAREFWQVKRFNINIVGHLCRADFKVNKKKRTVTCEIRGIRTGYIRKRATTKCHPNDVFNEDIGKAISLCMARDIDIPQEFLDAVQPTEFVIGQRFKYDTALVYEVTAIEGNKALVDDTDYYAMLMDFKDYQIIDDTNAEYFE